MTTERTMPEIVRDLGAVREEHARLAALLDARALASGEAPTLARLDDELTRFHALCMGVRPFRLYATGILPGDELRHPMSDAPGRAVTVSRIEIDGEAMTIAEATRRIAAQGGVGRGLAIGNWTARGIAIGDAMDMRPATDAGSVEGRRDGSATTSPPRSGGDNFTLAF